MDQNAKGKSEESCDCFLGLRTICGSAYKLFMAAYCCSTSTFWLLTHLQPSAAHLSLFKPNQPPHPPTTTFLCPPCDSAHLFFSFSFFSRLNLCPTSQEAPCFTSSRETKSDFKTLLHFFFSLPVCLSPSVCIFSPLPHTSSSADTALMCAFGKGGWGWWVGVGGFKKRRAGLGVGWGVTSHNHQSDRYQGQLS